MNKSRLLCAICVCLIAFFSVSTNAAENVLHPADNSNTDIGIQKISPRDHRIKHSNTSAIDHAVFIISVGLIGFYLLRKANNG